LPTAFIYIISAADTPIKIGWSDDPDKRVRALQTSHPDELAVRFALEVPRIAAKDIESSCHNYLEPVHRRGEWYDTTIAEGIAVITDHAARLVRMHVSLAGTKDIFKYLEAKYGLHAFAREGVAMYRRVLSGDGSKDRLNYLVRLMRSGANKVTVVEIFHAVVLGGIPITSTQNGIYTSLGAAEKDLVAAIDALGEEFRTNEFERPHGVLSGQEWSRYFARKKAERRLIAKMSLQA
jgi:hypothetical protein